MLDENKYETFRMVVDCTLSSAFKGYVTKWEPIFFHFLVVVAFFAFNYMITHCCFSVQCPLYLKIEKM
jgi:hypothetical protein